MSIPLRRQAVVMSYASSWKARASSGPHKERREHVRSDAGLRIGKSNRRRLFESFSEIKNLRLSLAISVAEIKQIKEIKRATAARAKLFEFRQTI
jgi:hypothetical protein